jgi:hypothetical protein
MAQFKWTQDMRRAMYRRLKSDFGVFAKWGQGPQGGDVLSPLAAGKSMKRCFASWLLSLAEMNRSGAPSISK